MDETYSEDESLKTPEQQIMGMGKAILKAVDEIIEERGWGWSKKPRSEIPRLPPSGPGQAQLDPWDIEKYSLQCSERSLGRRFDSKNLGGLFLEEAYCMRQVLERGIIPVIQIPPRQKPLPYGIIINLRAAPEFKLSGWDSDKLDAEGVDVYKKKTGQVMEDLLKKLGFQVNFLATPEELSHPSARVTLHTYVYDRTTREGHYISSVPDRKFDYSWILGSDREGATFTEIQHPTLPFVADVIKSHDREPPLVFIRYIPKSSLELEVQDASKAVTEAEKHLKETGGIRDEVEELLEDGLAGYPKTLKYVEQATLEILAKQETLAREMALYPKQKLDLRSPGQKDQFIARLGSGSDIESRVLEEDGFSYLRLMDEQPPLKFDCTFLKFSTPEEGAKHPYTREVKTDNLLIIGRRDEVNQPWKLGTYLISPDGALRRLLEPGQEEEELETKTPKGLREELNLISSTLDIMIERLQQKR